MISEKKLARELDAYMEKSGLSIRDVGVLLKIPHSTVHRIRRHLFPSSAENFIKIAKMLGYRMTTQ